MQEIARCNVPIVFIVFNRPDHTRAVFQRIAAVRPPRLLLIADGPRNTRPAEGESCFQVRQIVKEVDWPCEVSTNFAEENLGCRKRIVTGLNWAFSQVEEAIILEDDIAPDPSFFRFCEEMLIRYRGDSTISMITGFNIVEDHSPQDWSYFYSKLTHIWGWATWRNSWQRYDEHLRDWPAIKAAGLMRQYFRLPEQQRFWTWIFDQMHAGRGPDTWDYQWFYTNLIHNALSITPRVNLIENIGFGPEATHTTDIDAAPGLKAGTLTFPLIHPPAVTDILELDELDGKRSGSFIPSLHQRALRKARRLLARSRAQKAGEVSA
jgi:hypothetical protein